MTIDGASIRDVLIGIGVLLAGLGVILVSAAMARLLGRVNKTLDEVDRQIAALSAPVVETLAHVGGIADTADTTVARLGTVVGSLENVVENVGGTAKLASDAVAPAIVNLGAMVTGITAGLRKLVSGKSSPVGEDLGNG